MISLSKEFKVGILGIAAVVILYFGVKFLNGSDILRSTNVYYARFDHIEGLTTSNPVMINGYTVGLVKDIEYIPRHSKPLLVMFDVDKKVKLTDSALVILTSNGLLGGKMLVLEPGNGQNILRNNDTVNTYTEKDLTTQLQEKAVPMIDDLSAVLTTANQLLQSFENSAQKLNAALEQIKALSASANQLVESNSANLKKTTQNISELSQSLKVTESHLRELTVKFNRLGDTLNKAPIAAMVKSLDNTSRSLNQAVDNINKGKGTLGKLAKNDSLYNNLNASTAALNALLMDLKASPKRYVHFSLFGRKENKGTK